MYKVIVGDEKPIVRYGLKHLATEIPDVVVSAEAGSDLQLLEYITDPDFEIDLVIFDNALFGTQDIEFLRQVRTLRKNLPLLVFGKKIKDGKAMRLLKAGATGYLPNDAHCSEILLAVKKLLNGERYVSPLLTESLVTEAINSDRYKPHETLSEREFEIFSQLAAGITVSEIAQKLFLSVKTVSTHRRHVLRKMELKNNFELTQYALKNNLLDIRE